MLKPLKNNVIIEQVEDKKTTSSGILLPEEVKNKSLIGIVIAKGNTVSSDIKIGDKIVYEFSDSIINDIKKKYIVVREENIIAIIE
jgi:chaperonin GroES